MQRYGFRPKKKELVVDQDLPHFYDAIKIGQARRLVMDYDYYDKQLGIKIVQKDLIDELRKKKKQSDKPIMGSAWYNILENFYYSVDFAYVPPSIPNRHKLIYKDQNESFEDDDDQKSF